jgi:subtilisin-like proprotein convertase family protein
VKTLLGCLVVALVLGSALRIDAESEGKNLRPPSGVQELANSGPRRVPRSLQTDVFSSTDVPQAIPDDDETGISSTIEVPSAYPSKISDVNLVLNSLSHTCVADLHIELVAPSGLSIVLIASSLADGIFTGLGCPANFSNTVLDDDAPTNLIALPLVPPFEGSFNVDHLSVGPTPLEYFDGEAAGGTWTVEVSDRGNNDTGSLNAWSLEITHELFTATSVSRPRT